MKTERISLILWLTILWWALFLPPAVYLSSQLAGTFEGYDASCRQDCILVGSRIAAITLQFFLYAKLAKPGHQDIVTGF